MNNREYLSEEEYQKINKKVGLIGKVLLFIGTVGFITCSILLFGNFISFESKGLVGFLWVGCFTCIGFGLMFFMRSNSRKITAYMVQQQMPIIKEGTEKMAPTAGAAAKEIAKGIKEGLKDSE